MAPIEQPGSPTAFEALVDDYDAARPRYPAQLYDALPPLRGTRLLELGAGTGIASSGLVSRGARLVSTDLGPRMLARLHATFPSVPVCVARAERLPFAEASFDAGCGAQMWHWTGPGAAEEVARVLRPGGWLALWWNEVKADGVPWWEDQQARLEAGNPRYRRGYREVDYSEQLAGLFRLESLTILPWERVLSLDLYERWLRSKSYVQALVDHGGPGSVEDFVQAERSSLLGHFPDGLVRESFGVRLWLFRRR